LSDGKVEAPKMPILGLNLPFAIEFKLYVANLSTYGHPLIAFCLNGPSYFLTNKPTFNI